MVEVIVPATSANMGPGFDCLGVAVNLYNRFLIEEIEDGLFFEGCENAFKNEDNLIYKAMKKCFERIGYKPRGLKIVIKGDIPVSRGLGSSAACVVGGIIGANELAGGLLSKQEILDLAAEMEGHPDNITPAIFGGVTVSVSEGDKVFYNKVKVKDGIKLCALIPEFELATEKARAILPKMVDYKQSIYNIGRAALLVTALCNGDFELLKYACKDKLHEDYRAPFIQDFYLLKEECEMQGGLGVFLSGAGPTMMVILSEEDKSFIGEMQNYLGSLRSKWSLKELTIENTGTIVNRVFN